MATNNSHDSRDQGGGGAIVCGVARVYYDGVLWKQEHNISLHTALLTSLCLASRCVHACVRVGWPRLTARFTLNIFSRQFDTIKYSLSTTSIVI